MELRKDWIAYRMRAYLQIFRGQESYSKWQYMVSQIVKINKITSHIIAEQPLNRYFCV